MTTEILRVSSAWSRAVVGAVAELDPAWRHAFDLGTELLLGVFAVLFLASWWRARSVDARAVGLALLAPVATVVAYLVSRTVKEAVAQQRPCQAMTDLVTAAACPPAGDWSFPSNHAAIAGAAAAALILAWRRIAVVIAVFAALEAFSRVAVGVHYPHDVTVGLLLGALVATVVSLALARPLTLFVERLATVDRLRPLVRSAGSDRPADRHDDEHTLTHA
ncbi:phosphatase PAP2 family protein [Nocardiopsis sp. NRRL B-16309]|uniref:phosphatase PAP2 family protein n=1 Tax=Nocardiopsis sp. NRRL B-16309 TaxID=1519494 RepID=UPI0006AE0552|nr:phosphatase PAP2 family protein [Nocardiopsis sp. NRRL B-16309]KOX17081.1 membrane protein [Nocardiopsis sp. NRRL B-16309]